MRVLFDTDVTLDLLLDRSPHAEAATILFSQAESGLLEGYLCATTVTTIHYLASKGIGNRKSRNAIRKLLSFLAVATVDGGVIARALDGKFRDFEDAVIDQAAKGVGAAAIITRNIRDYKHSEIPAYLPQEFLAIYRLNL